MISGAEELTAPSQSDFPPLMVVEREYIQDGGSIGSVPMPGTMKGMLKSVMEKMTGHNPEILIKNSGNAWPSSARVYGWYPAMIIKCESMDIPDEISLDMLRHFRDEGKDSIFTSSKTP